MTKHIKNEDLRGAGEPIEVPARAEGQSQTSDTPDKEDGDDEGEEPASPPPSGIEPFDLFGDYELTGRQELTRDMVPDVIYEYAHDAGRRPGVNAGPIALSCLIAAGVAIRHPWRIQPKLNDTGWVERPAIWGGITGDPSAKKSHVGNLGRAPLDRIEADADERHEERMDEWRSEMFIHKEELKDWRAAMKEAKEGGMSSRDFITQFPAPEEPLKPQRTRVKLEDLTYEGALKVCAANPSGIMIFQDELTSWIASFDMYSKGGGGRDRAGWLNGYNSSSTSKDRAGQDNPLRVESFAVSVLGGIQDDKLRQDFSNQTRDGFLARFMFVEAQVMEGCDEDPDEIIAQNYETAIRNVYGLHVEEENGQTGLVRMSPEAAAVREEIEGLTRALNTSPSVVPALKDHLGKWPGIFSRLCLIYHMLESRVGKAFDPETTPVSEETARKVYAFLVDFILPEQARIYTQVMEAGDDQEKHARWIAGHILAGGIERISTYDIRRAFGSIANDDWSLKKATSSLEIMGWITADQKKDGSLYSRHNFDKMKWRVNTRVHEIFAERAAEEKIRRTETMDQIADSAKKIRAIKSRRRK